MAQLNINQVKGVAKITREMPDSGSGLNFYSFRLGNKEIVQNDMYPPLNHPLAVNFFIVACLHQHGFWFSNERGYLEPLVGSVDGAPVKSSNLIFKVLRKRLDTMPDIFELKWFAQNGASLDDLKNIFSDDYGPIPFPDWDARYVLTQWLSMWFWKTKANAPFMIRQMSRWADPLYRFREQMKKIGGYDSDPFEKKSLLLAMALANRPEKFLQVTDPENWAPIVDYHLMRICLRTGMVELNEGEIEVNMNRKWVNQKTEEDIRKACFDAVSLLIKLSGKPMSFIDEKLLMARKYCPEMSNPDCNKCVFEDVCKKRTELFQPVFRTVAY